MIDMTLTSFAIRDYVRDMTKVPWMSGGCGEDRGSQGKHNIWLGFGSHLTRCKIRRMEFLEREQMMQKERVSWIDAQWGGAIRGGT